MSNAAPSTNFESTGMHIAHRFEQAMAVTLAVLVAVAAIVSAAMLLVEVYLFVISTTDGSFDSEGLKTIFAHALLVLIALELNHSILRSLGTTCAIIQIKTILMIALLAVLRKLLVLDYSETGVEMVVGLSLSALVLCGAYQAFRQQSA